MLRTGGKTLVSAIDPLSNPLVLWGAWLRVDAWYRSGNLAPQPELARWRLHPEQELRALRAELQRDQWQPRRWPQVPYPKKGARLRHYVLPTVRDQVAFMAHMVLLGPLLDRQLVKFAFGNRWYRPVVWDRRRSRPQWVPLPYPCLTHKSYLPYARSHGLFRRVAHWTVARMTGAPVAEGDYAGDVQRVDDYPDSSLPPWIRDAWWNEGGTGSGPAYWATIDIEVAYPSVRLHRLRDSLAQMLEGADMTVAYLAGYPGSVLAEFTDNDSRQQVGRRLVDALDQVQINAQSIPLDTWRPCHAPAELPPENKGIPTGLAISGLLLNVALHSTDVGVLQYLQRQRGERRGAIVRFADDMCVFSRSISGLLDLIDQVWRALSDSDEAQLAVPTSRSNLYLNFAKIGPSAVQDIVSRFLAHHGWDKCEDCEELRPPSTVPRAMGLAQWWESQEGTGERDRLEKAVSRELIRAKEVGPFVTTLVARLSEMARDTLTERFGEGAKVRLVRLHELARLDIKDDQIRPDTRRAFAVNRLVRAWLPADAEGGRRALMEVRESIAQVLHNTPWKFAVWRAVVRAAARRPTKQDFDEANREADEWLIDQLRRVAYTPDSADPQSWMFMWPEEIGDKNDGRDPSWRNLYLSFHRTAFWHALGDILLELWRHHNRTTYPYAGDPGPPPEWWTVRAIPRGMHKDVATFLGHIDRWVSALYLQPNALEPDLANWPWELDRVVVAMLASLPAAEAAESWRRTERPGEIAMIPEIPFRNSAPDTVRVLAHAGRVRYERGTGRPLKLDTAALAHVALSGRDGRLGEVLFPGRRSPRILGAMGDPRHTMSVGVSLGCSDDIDAEFVADVAPESGQAVALIRSDPLVLFEYRRARRILMSRR